MSYVKFLSTLTALAFIASPVAAQMSDTATDHGNMDHSEMDHGDMDHSDMDHSDMSHGDMDPSSMDHSNMDHSGMDHSKMDHSGHDMDSMADSHAIVEAPIEGSTITAKVNGLVCDFCAQALRKVFKKQDAVNDINVDLDAGEVNVFLKSGETMDDETLKKLIRKSGYSLVGIERSSQ